MAKKQTRRSVSLSRTTYEKLKAYCESAGISMSQFTEVAIDERIAQPKEAAVGG
jgi:post-segregation antitoxin (ccd killing protein)